MRGPLVEISWKIAFARRKSERERERERESQREGKREREREKQRDKVIHWERICIYI